MPKVTFVKAARKENPVAKVGESYYWWAHMVGGRGGPKQYSKTAPKQSQLTQSEYYQSLYSLQESVSDSVSFEDLESELSTLAESLREIGEEQRSKYDNLPEGFQQGDTGQLLEQRADSCESAADEIDSLHDFDESEKEEDETQEEFEARLEEEKQSYADEKWDEAKDLLNAVE